MTPFVTLAQASAHLRRDTDADDNDLTMKIQAASGLVQNYLKKASPWSPEYEVDSAGDQVLDSAGLPVPVIDSGGRPVYAVDSAGDKIPRPEVVSATLMMVGYLYKDRDENKDGAFDRGYLPMPVTAMLYPLRDPALA